MAPTVSASEFEDRQRDIDDLRWVLRTLTRFSMPVDVVAARLNVLIAQPVRLRCRVCRRRHTEISSVDGYTGPFDPVCERCECAGCDRQQCYVPFAVAVDVADSSVVLCAAHGLEFIGRQIPAGACIRHLVDGASVRAAYDERVTRRRLQQVA